MSEVSKKESKEDLIQVENVWLFDVDGVLTNPDTKKIDPAMSNEIIQKLENGEPVALVTGRSLVWLRERVLPELEKRVGDKKIFGSLFLSGEKGGIWAEWKDGTWQIEYDEEISMPKNLVEESRKLAKNEQFRRHIFFDETKETMISIEIYGGEDAERVKREKEALRDITEELEKLILDLGLEEELEVDLSEIAVDVQRKSINKSIGTKRVLSWLTKKGLRPKIIIAFGDSPRDLEMVEPLGEENLSFQFVYVGPKEIPQQTFPIIQTSAKFDQGTLEFLRSQRAPH